MVSVAPLPRQVSQTQGNSILYHRPHTSLPCACRHASSCVKRILQRSRQGVGHQRSHDRSGHHARPTIRRILVLLRQLHPLRKFSVSIYFHERGMSFCLLWRPHDGVDCLWSSDLSVHVCVYVYECVYVICIVYVLY